MAPKLSASVKSSYFKPTFSVIVIASAKAPNNLIINTFIQTD